MTGPNYKFIKVFAITGIFVATLFLPAFFGNASLIDDIKQQITNREKELKELEEKMKIYKGNITDFQKQQKTLQGKIASINEQIEYLKSQIGIFENKIDQTSLYIKKLKIEIEKQEEAIQMKKVYIASAIQIINEQDKVPLFEVMLENRDFSKFLSQTEYIKSLEEEIQNNINSLQLLKSRLESKREEQEKREEELKDLKADLESQKTISFIQKGEKETILKQTKNQENKYAALLSETQKKRQDIQKEVYELEEKLKYTIDQSTIPAARKGLLDWPANGRLTQGYGPTSQTGFINNVYNFHNGIDIASPIGTPIYAPLGGKIISSGDNGEYAYGKWIAIDHENGLITLYAHLSLKSVSVGDKVQKGQKIGYMGSTGFSTGSHLHFTVYAANTFQTTQRWYGLLPLGASINPFNYLK